MDNNTNNNVENTQPTIIPNNVNTTPTDNTVVNTNSTVQPVVSNNKFQMADANVYEQPSTQPNNSVVQQTNTVVNQTNPVLEQDSKAIINENLKKVEIDYKPPTKAKTVLLVMFFLVLIAFVWFLPNITSLINRFKSGPSDEDVVITTGKLKCSRSTSTTNLDKDYDLVFTFVDSKLEKTEFVITTKGDITLDEEALDELAATCKQLKTNAESISGVIIQCNYSEGKLEEIQSFDLEKVDQEELNAAYIEAGGNNPEYKFGQNIDGIERNLNASDYTCTRER